MMLHPHPGRGRWLLALAAGGAWLLTGQHLAGQAGADQAGRPHATTLAPTTSTPVQQRPLAPARPASASQPPTSTRSSTGTSRRSSPRSSTDGEVGPRRGSGLATGPFPRTASRTRRAPFNAPGSPQVPEGLWVFSSRGRPGSGDGCAPVAVADRAHRRGVKQLPVVTGRPRSDAAVAAADLLPRGLGVLAA